MKTDPVVLTLIPDKPLSRVKKKRKRKKGPHRKCTGKFCRRIIYGAYLCSRCRWRKLKMERPLEYAYQMQRSNAKKRKPKHFPDGIPFTVSREEYKRVWEDNPEKWKEKVKSLQNPQRQRTCNWEVDRIDPYKGYEEGNLRIISKLMNILYWYNPRIGQMELDLFCMVQPEISEDKYKNIPF